jgi:hypothetical protein
VFTTGSGTLPTVEPGAPILFISIVDCADFGALPSAKTCARELVLPDYIGMRLWRKQLRANLEMALDSTAANPLNFGRE